MLPLTQWQRPLHVCFRQCEDIADAIENLHLVEERLILQRVGLQATGKLYPDELPGSRTKGIYVVCRLAQRVDGLLSVLKLNRQGCFPENIEQQGNGDNENYPEDDNIL